MNKTIRVWFEESKEVTLSKSTMIEVTDATLREIYDIPKQALINDKNYLCEWWETGSGGHSWFEEKKIRRATNQDKMIMKILDKLRQKDRETDDEK